MAVAEIEPHGRHRPVEQARLVLVPADDLVLRVDDRRFDAAWPRASPGGLPRSSCRSWGLLSEMRAMIAGRGEMASGQASASRRPLPRRVWPSLDGDGGRCRLRSPWNGSSSPRVSPGARPAPPTRWKARPLADGAGPTTWHEFTHRRAGCRTARRETSPAITTTATGRTSRSWSGAGAEGLPVLGRVGTDLPRAGQLNQKGLDFYDRLVDCAPGSGHPAVADHLPPGGAALARARGRIRRSASRWITWSSWAPRCSERLGDRVTELDHDQRADDPRRVRVFPRRVPARAGSSPCAACSTASTTCSWRTRGCAMPGLPLGDRADIGLAHHSVWMAPADAEPRTGRRAAAFMDDVANRTVLDPILRGAYPAERLDAAAPLLPAGLRDGTSRR